MIQNFLTRLYPKQQPKQCRINFKHTYLKQKRTAIYVKQSIDDMDILLLPKCISMSWLALPTAKEATRIAPNLTKSLFQKEW